MKKVYTLGLIVAGLLWAGCRGDISHEPPRHVNMNMDAQEKFEAQERSPLFSDQRAMRPVVPGTVARGNFHEDSDMPYQTGRELSGAYMQTSPVPLTRQVLERGQQRYEIYCAPCHSPIGDGRGLVVARGYAIPNSYHIDRLRDVEDGYMFEVITNGYGNMPAYGPQVPVADRWAIIHYVRALQRSQNARAADVPPGATLAPNVGETNAN